MSQTKPFAAIGIAADGPASAGSSRMAIFAW
jgi:hypothetical protein